MIGSIIILMLSIGLLLKGVPTWLSIILSIVNIGCVFIAFTVWEDTKSRITSLEEQLKELWITLRKNR